MSEQTVADAKLIQYLNEAHAKEKELETSLAAHIAMAEPRKPYQKRLKEHLKETRNHAKLLERRLKKLGAGPAVLPKLASRGTALAKGQLHAVRGTGLEEKLLKNAKTEYSEEHEEIATYNAIEAFAEKVGDKETAKVARQIRREEQKMANYLERLIPTLTNAVVTAEVPASERSNTRRRSSRKSTSRKRSSSSGRSSSRSRSGNRSGTKASSRKRSGSSRSSSSSRSGGSRSSSRSRSGGSRSRSRAGSRG